MGSYLRGGLLLFLVSNWAALSVLAQDPTWTQLPWEERIGIGWYRSLAERGDPEAAYRLGLLHERGLGGSSDGLAARENYEAAARQGHARAQFALARLLQADEPEAAATWYREAAKAGSPGAAFNLALMLENGQGIPVDHADAALFYERAFAGGLDRAALHRGLLEMKRPEPDRVLALSWLLLAHEEAAPAAEKAARAIGAEMSAEERARAERLAQERR
ncbi:MAG TPA: tetratricopeptide repeat protein [Kiloniellales bacterium]|nr:tetratricopeptide repeat protein [Kiloniellales bacterium]